MDARFIVLMAYLCMQAAEFGLQFLNLGHLHRQGSAVPAEFRGHIDEPLLRKTQAYTAVRTGFSLVESCFGIFIVLIFFYGGIFDRYNSWVMSFDLAFPLQGALYFLLLSYAASLLSLPFGLYGTFRIENRFGFNTMTGRLWFADFLKSLMISTVLLGVLFTGGFWIVQASPEYWWLFVWAGFFLFSIFLMYISPYVIEPLFNKFSPLEDENLTGRIRDMLSAADIRVSRVFVMDSSKRSTHTNAYFTGIGRTKRIILYDTLLKKLDHDEILAVLAHEAGHWKKRHVLKMIALFETFSFAGAYLAFRLIESGAVSAVFPLAEPVFFSDCVVIGFVASFALFPLTPLMSGLSRRHERDADRFASALSGMPGKLASSLIKLSRDNLSNLRPHPLYAAVYYSHPPVLQRVRALSAQDSR